MEATTIPMTEGQKILCYQILEAGVPWKKLEASSKGTGAIGETRCCLEMQAETGENIPPSSLLQLSKLVS